MSWLVGLVWCAPTIENAFLWGTLIRNERTMCVCVTTSKPQALGGDSPEIKAFSSQSQCGNDNKQLRIEITAK